jgi:hypothetical protein
MDEKRIINFLDVDKPKREEQVYKIFLNSDFAERDENKGTLKWEIIRDKGSLNGSLPVLQFVKKIKAIKFEPFQINLPDKLQYTEQPTENFYLQMLVEEFKIDSFVTRDSNFHFMFSADTTEWFNYIKYEFFKEIPMPQTLTLRLLYELRYIPFYSIPYYLGYVDMLTLVTGGFLHIATSLSATLDFDGCTLSHFTTTDAVTDAAIINTINTYVLGGGNYTIIVSGPTTFIRTDIDVSAVVTPINLNSIRINFPQVENKIKYNIPVSLYY